MQLLPTVKKLLLLAGRIRTFLTSCDLAYREGKVLATVVLFVYNLCGLFLPTTQVDQQVTAARILDDI
jgi:hypothetical protein